MWYTGYYIILLLLQVLSKTAKSKKRMVLNAVRDNNGQAEPREDIVIGRNAVLELLKTDRQVECIYIQKGLTGTISKIAAISRDKNVVVKEVAAVKLDSLCAHANHQGVAAQTSAAVYSEIEDIFQLAESRGEPAFIVVADEIEDPHNLGAIIRSAEAAGAHGLIIPKRRSAGLTFAVSKASAGATEHLPVAKVANISAALGELKRRGCWVYAADMDGKSWCEADYSGAVALVVGSEGKGVGRLVKENCDFIVSLPMRGRISSLNASVAAGIIMYEIARQRTGLLALNK